MLTSVAASQLETRSPSLPGRSPSLWINVVSHLDPKYGGLSSVVPQLVASLATDRRFRLQLEAFCLPGEEHRPEAAGDLPISFWPTSRKAWCLQHGLSERIRQALVPARGIHIHGLWEQSSLAAARASRALRVPYIVSAHGMLEPWALAQGRLKKQVYASLVERPNLNAAACVHALTEAEAANYRDFGCTRPIAVIPNAVTIPETLDPERFLAAWPAARGRRVLLFLGRLHRKKGVELLVRAWGRARGRLGGAADDSGANHPLLVLAGPTEDQTRTRVEELIAELGLTAEILLTGMLDTPTKWSALAAAEGFVLPSFSEGLSIAVLEAMGVGLPVIVTENCNVPEVAHSQAGWQVQADEAALAEALAAWLAASPAACRALGRRGAALVRERFSWPAVTRQMTELYRWVERGEEPRSFRLQRVEGAR